MSTSPETEIENELETPKTKAAKAKREANKPDARPESKHLSLLRPVASPDQIAQAHQEVSALIVKSLKEGQDYGHIPGAGDKQVLLKPGAERLAIAFGCRVEYEIVEKEIDHDRRVAFTLAKWIDTDRRPPKEEADRLKAQSLGRWRKGFGGKWTWQEKNEERGESYGLYRYVIRCRLVRHDGLVVGDAIGACSSLETKYIRSPRDSENTIVKMAQKRALVAVALNAFGLSDRFTQDIEEMADVLDAELVDRHKGGAKQDHAKQDHAKRDDDSGARPSRRAPRQLEAALVPEAPNPVQPPRPVEAPNPVQPPLPAEVTAEEEALVELLVHAPQGQDGDAYRRYFEEHRSGLSRAEQAVLRAWLYARRNAANGLPEGEDNDVEALERAKALLETCGA